MAKELEVKVRLTADVSDAEQAFKSAGAAVKGTAGDFGKLDTATAKSESRLTQFTTFLKTKFVFTLGDVQRAISQVFASIQSSITLKRQQTALKGQLTAMGLDFDTFIGKLKSVSNNTVSTSDLIASSSRALLLGIPAEEISTLLEISASRAAATGRSIANAFNDITTGIGRSSAKILDNLGFIVKLDKVYEELARSLGKNVEQLTEAERRTAVLSSVIREGTETMSQFGSALDDTGTSLDKTSAAMANFKGNANDVISAIGTGLAAILTRASAGFVALALGVTLSARAFVALLGIIPGVGSALEGTSESLKNASESLNRTMKAMVDNANALSASSTQQAAELLGLASATDTVSVAGLKLIQTQIAEKQAMEDASIKAAALKSQVLSLAAAQDALATAANKASAALGTVTSIELQNQIFDIIVGLEAQKELLGENSEEFKTMNAVGQEQLKLLNERVVSLQSGLGDLKDEAIAVGDAFDGTAQRSQALIDANRGVGDSARALQVDMRDTINTVDGVANSFDGAASSALNFGTASRSVRSTSTGGTTSRSSGTTSRTGLLSQPPLFSSLPSNGLGAFQSRSRNRTFVIPSTDFRRVN